MKLGKMHFFFVVAVSLLVGASAFSMSGCCNSDSPGGFENMCQ
jgi:hypothetical protein